MNKYVKLIALISASYCVLVLTIAMFIATFKLSEGLCLIERRLFISGTEVLLGLFTLYIIWWLIVKIIKIGGKEDDRNKNL